MLFHARAKCCHLTSIASGRKSLGLRRRLIPGTDIRQLCGELDDESCGPSARSHRRAIARLRAAKVEELHVRQRVHRAGAPVPSSAAVALAAASAPAAGAERESPCTMSGLGPRD